MVQTSALPSVIAALVALTPDVVPAGVVVRDGVGVANDNAPDVLMVGVDDPDARQRTPAGESSQEWAQVGRRARNERGSVTCAALSWSGGTDQAAVREAAYATVAAVETLCRENTTLGVGTLEWSSFGTRQELQQLQDDKGVLAIVIFQVTYQARLT